MNRRSTYQSVAARGAYSSSRRVRLATTLSLFTVGAVALCLLAASLFGPVDAGFRPDAADATVGESFTSDTSDTPNEPDGSVKENEVTVFDTAHPAVAQLDAALLDALQAAANEAAAEDITFYVNSGWRSPQLQERLLEEAVAEYGSREEALRWVATPERSAHVSGDAVDIGPFDASYWLSYNGAKYGICQIYANEGWHFELRPDASESGCPELYTDPTEDPRMR